MTRARRRLGEVGEEAAVNYLGRLGYQILARNYCCPLGEIDIVARDGNTTVFVEVRLKTSYTFGTAEESITTRKAQRLKRLALYYLQKNGLLHSSCRIDLLAIKAEAGGEKIEKISHLKSIVEG